MRSARASATPRPTSADCLRSARKSRSVITIAEFNSAVTDLQKALRDGEKTLNGLEPPANARPANKKLAKAFGDLADALETVKEARRESIVKARQALGALGKTDAIKEGRAAILELNSLGYAAEAAAP